MRNANSPPVTMYTTAYCGYCVRAERLLAARGVDDVVRIRVDEEPAERVAMMKRTGRRTVPQIYIGDYHVGGYDELATLDRAGRLPTLLAGDAAYAAKPARGDLAPGFARHAGVKSPASPFSPELSRMADSQPAANADSQPAAAPGGGTSVQLSIEKIYVKDLSLENPGAPQSFQMTEPPQIEIGLRTRGEQVAPDIYECVLTLTVTARANDKTVFLVEASQAGVFAIRGVPPNHLQAVLAVHCPVILFPYARETVADATMRAGFPPVHLAPINFEALYQQQLAQASAEAPAVTN